jgi:hypothetical protein
MIAELPKARRDHLGHDVFSVFDVNQVHATENPVGKSVVAFFRSACRNYRQLLPRVTTGNYLPGSPWKWLSFLAANMLIAG